MPNLQTLVEQAKAKQELDLLDKIWMKVKPEDKEDKIIANIVSLTLNSLYSMASTLILLRRRQQGGTVLSGCGRPCSRATETPAYRAAIKYCRLGNAQRQADDGQ